MDKQENLIRKVLMNEFTWIALIAGFIITCFTKVILPINTMQIQLASIQSTINDLKSYDARITQNANDIIVLQQEYKSLIK